MVIGSGFIAKAFDKFNNIPNITIYASGVSNSNISDAAELDREIVMLKQYLHTKNCLVYFSTISIHDTSLENTPYVQHKKKIENIIKSNCTNYLIFRIPIVVGYSNNPYTLINTLVNQIKRGDTLKVFNKASRYLMDVDDIVRIATTIILDQKKHNTIWDMCFDNKTNISKIITDLENIVGIVAKKEYINKGCSYDVPNENFLTYLQSIGYILPENYIEQTLKKYYK